MSVPMKTRKKIIISLCLVAGFSFCLLFLSRQEVSAQKDYASAFRSLSSRVNKSKIQKGVYYLSSDPLPRRVLNWSVPGHTMSSLEEADAWISAQLKKYGYRPLYDSTKVRAFGRDTLKPVHHQYATPPADAPFYTARNVIAEKKGSKHPRQVIVIIAHKDSQSWIPSPGANDNAIGTVGALELARVLRKYRPEYTLRFIFCNEEHTPWTSITAAQNMKAAGEDVLALINLDALGGKPAEETGRIKNVTRFTTPEGEKLADLMIRLNDELSIGLEQSKFQSSRPGDDDGSFIKAGFPWAVLNIGSLPYGDPNYHLETDTADRVDYESATRAVQLTLAFVLYIDKNGRP